MRRDYKDVKARYGHEWTAGRAEYIAKLTGVPVPEKPDTFDDYVHTIQQHVNHVHLSIQGIAQDIGFTFQRIFQNIFSPPKPTRRMRTW